MARYTTAYSSFVSRLDEVEMLIRLAREKEKRSPVTLRKEINSLCRAAVVLLSSHLEGYVKDLGELALESLHSKQVPRTSLSSKLFYHISKGFFGDIQDTSDPEKMADRLFVFIGDDLHFWSRNGPFPQQVPVDRFNKGFSNPAFSKICAYIGRFGYSDYKVELARRLGAKNLPITNMIDHLVGTRNKIAHGDPMATEPPADVSTMVTTIRAYVETTDALFATWWKKNFCSIR
ncbi:MAE_28990/MAE_18760 family HEPN-like nuclease [Janthinobacterium sp. GB1R12]|uniref:MAE_28990/MAE_18760 family HEPN-like nuclease n=1 Tax=Janthinobacterium sp. GB1R12 TaxID=3424190 RepID=UPI003F1FD3AD